MRVCLILPYFGKLKSFFPVFLKSCAANPDVDLLLFTDDTSPLNYPRNVLVRYTTFEQFRKKLLQNLTFPLPSTTHIKLCDYKPAYGFVLEDEITAYDYWGHCDLIFGNMEKLLFPILKEGFNKVFAAGHLTLYRNTAENNRFFMQQCHGKALYREVFQSKSGFAFDEDAYDENVHSIFLESGRKTFCSDMCFNACIDYYNFVRTEYLPEKRKWEIQPYQKPVCLGKRRPSSSQ